MIMKALFQNLLNIINYKTIDYLSIQEVKELKILERKIEISKRFRKYVSNLNRKQNRWLKKND